MAPTTITRATWTDDDGSGTTGTILNNARLQGDVYDRVDGLFSAAAGLKSAGPLVERNRATPLGEWTALPYASAVFTAATGTWTVPSGAYFYQYALMGKTALLHFVVGAPGSTTSAATAYVAVNLPAGLAPASANTNMLGTINAGTLTAATVGLSSGGGIRIYPNVALSGTIPAATVYCNVFLFYPIP